MRVGRHVCCWKVGLWMRAIFWKAWTVSCSAFRSYASDVVDAWFCGFVGIVARDVFCLVRFDCLLHHCSVVSLDGLIVVVSASVLERDPGLSCTMSAKENPPYARMPVMSLPRIPKRMRVEAPLRDRFKESCKDEYEWVLHGLTVLMIGDASVRCLHADMCKCIFGDQRLSDSVAGRQNGNGQLVAGMFYISRCQGRFSGDVFVYYDGCF